MSRLAVFAFCLLAIVQPAWAVSLLNGSVLTVNGLTMTVSGCSVILAGATQSSCASGHLLLQALTSASGAGYSIVGDGTGYNGSDALSAAEASGLSQLRFTLTIAPASTGSHTKVSSAVLTIHGSVPDYRDLANVSAHQHFSAAAGNTNFLLIPDDTNTASAAFSPVNSFSISNTLAINSTNYNGYGTLRLSTMQETFGMVPEPATIFLLLIGVGSLAMVRLRRRS